MNCEKNLKKKMNNLFIAQNVPHIILGGGSKILIDIEVTITSLISIPTKYPSCVFSCTPIMQDMDNSGQFLMPIAGNISSSELGLATKKLLTQRFEFDMREMDGVEMEILTKDSGNPYLSIYNPDTEEEYAGRYNIDVYFKDWNGDLMSDIATENGLQTDSYSIGLPDPLNQEYPEIEENREYILGIDITIVQ